MMSAGFRPFQPKAPEWLHSGRYVLIALLLHVLVLLYPLSLSIDPRESPPPGIVQVQLPESLSTAPAPPSAIAQKPSTPPTPRREKAVRPATPVIALAAEQPSAPPTFSVPAPVATPPAAPVTPTAAPAATPPAPVSAPSFNAAYLRNPEPKYPSLSRRLGEEGRVLLRVRVTADGRAAAVDIEKSSHFERLDEAARQGVTNWRFVPARRGEEAIEATVIVPIVFRLDN